MAARPTILITYWHDRVCARLAREDPVQFTLGTEYGTSELAFIRSVLPAVMMERGIHMSLSDGAGRQIVFTRMAPLSERLRPAASETSPRADGGI